MLEVFRKLASETTKVGVAQSTRVQFSVDRAQQYEQIRNRISDTLPKPRPPEHRGAGKLVLKLPPSAR